MQVIQVSQGDISSVKEIFLVGEKKNREGNIWRRKFFEEKKKGRMKIFGEAKMEKEKEENILLLFLQRRRITKKEKIWGREIFLGGKGKGGKYFKSEKKFREGKEKNGEGKGGKYLEKEKEGNIWRRKRR